MVPTPRCNVAGRRTYHRFDADRYTVTHRVLARGPEAYVAEAPRRPTLGVMAPFELPLAVVAAKRAYGFRPMMSVAGRPVRRCQPAVLTVL